MNDGLLVSHSRSIEPAPRDRVAAIASAMQRRPIVLVLGMHRSGTSLCSHILSAIGVDMADVIPGPGHTSPAPDNPRGHWERWEIVEFHDRILGLFNRDYWGRFHDFPLPVAWWADPRVAQIRREMIAFLSARMGEGYFGFKDPRTVRLMPVWHQIFTELKLAPKIVLCLRNPAQVARSLNARDGLDPAVGEYRWLVHTVDFYRYANYFEVCTVEYEGWFSEPSANLEKLKQFLGLPWQQSESELGLMLSGIIDPTARHDGGDHREPGQPLVRSLYKLVRRAGRDGAAHNQIASIASQFVGFQQLQGPFRQAFEDLAKVVAGIEQELVALRSAAGEREALVDALERRASAAEARLAEALAEVEAQRAQLNDLAGERDARAAIEGEASCLKATLAEREVALEELSCRADELLAALQSAQAERAAAAEAAQADVAALQGVVASTEQQAAERGAAAAAMEAELATLRGVPMKAEEASRERAMAAAALQSEVSALWDTLALGERERQDGISAGRALQRELSALREVLARGEQEGRERQAPAEALRAEITALQATLTAAREVGKAAIAAFRIDSVAPTKPERAAWMAPGRYSALRHPAELLKSCECGPLQQSDWG